MDATSALRAPPTHVADLATDVNEKIRMFLEH